MNQGLSQLVSVIACALLATVAPARPAVDSKIPVRVVVVTTFELGEDAGDTPGEFQYWVERLPLPVTMAFPIGVRPLRYNPVSRVLGVVVGAGSINSSASVMALGLDGRFDLTKAYWIVAGIAGINPNAGSVGSAAWAEWIVDRDLTHEIDAREIPPGWATGLVPLTRSLPFQGPPPQPGMFSSNVYHLNAGLVDWAYRLTSKVELADSAALKAIRGRYADQPPAREPPRVMKGDTISANDWWLGSLLNTAAEDWMAYWTHGAGRSVTSAMEDAGIVHSLQMLSRAKLVDASRVLVLRTASNYTAPAAGQSAAEMLAAESSSDSATQLSAFVPALEAAYRAGSPVVNELTSHWRSYESQLPGAQPP